MKLITRNTDYAIRAVCYISKQKNIVSVGELVRILGVPRPFMRKILQELSRKHILSSSKGQGGGFRLKIPAQKLYVVQLMQIFQGRISPESCFLKKDVCPNRGKCVLRKKIQLIEENAFRELKKINIASLV